jgi:hypothetical protein|tara:strand:- start:18058 stop:18240 length:183 start_codon:yes stop_codon:yes gene_type:complete
MKQNFTRNDVLKIFETLQTEVYQESLSRVLDVKEQYGFKRDEEPTKKKEYKQTGIVLLIN